MGLSAGSLGEERPAAYAIGMPPSESAALSS